MLRIGDFSKLSRISIRMLRHYDEIGLLHPDSVDDFTGYRYYSEAQLPLAGRIQTLKSPVCFSNQGSFAVYLSRREQNRLLIQNRNCSQVLCAQLRFQPHASSMHGAEIHPTVSSGA